MRPTAARGSTSNARPLYRQVQSRSRTLLNDAPKRSNGSGPTRASIEKRPAGARSPHRAGDATIIVRLNVGAHRIKRPARIKVDPLPACPDGIATIVAVPIDGGDVLIREAANQAVETSFLKLRNWKMLLGRSNAELQTEVVTNPDLAKLLHETSLDEVAMNYFKAMLQQTLGNEPEILEKTSNNPGYSPYGIRRPSSLAAQLQTQD